MSNTNVIDFISHFDKKQRRERVREQLSASGWDVAAATDVLDSDVCVYLMDTKESAVVMYGTSFSKLPDEDEVPSIDWQHFVLAWDVIVLNIYFFINVIVVGYLLFCAYHSYRNYIF